LPNGKLWVFHISPGSCHASPAPHLPFSNLDPSDQIAFYERETAAARADREGASARREMRLVHHKKEVAAAEPYLGLFGP